MMNFNGYGCHCGLGGDPETPPIDAVDECCYHHDRCYGYIDVFKITKFLTPYYWYTKFGDNDYRVNCSS
ncbi:unnamed protein product [Cylicostephanus goldi]|uniref:Phospholipase A2-like central domain-containing protein n=1 Tax=Cylicostephanus goldi TaxID=71465 RepID=A0A3P6TB31_CYLGO|nr:unnamed protein product [Cylicostephanus goldi]